MYTNWASNCMVVTNCAGLSSSQGIPNQQMNSKHMSCHLHRRPRRTIRHACSLGRELHTRPLGEVATSLLPPSAWQHHGPSESGMASASTVLLQQPAGHAACSRSGLTRAPLCWKPKSNNRPQTLLAFLWPVMQHCPPLSTHLSTQTFFCRSGAHPLPAKGHAQSCHWPARPAPLRFCHLGVRTCPSTDTHALQPWGRGAVQQAPHGNTLNP
jgi:hypothetical protein